MGGGIVYSKEKKVIGTWIDGKNIYRRVYSLTSPSSVPNNYIELLTIPETIDTLVSIGGSLKWDDTNNGWVAMPVETIQNGNVVERLNVYSQGKTLFLRLIGNHYLNKKMFVTIEFTDADE